jgi:hypothetical protein
LRWSACQALPLAGLAVIVVWYPLLQLVLTHTAWSIDPFRPALLGLTFNSMLDHLLQGRFDVDPAAIDFEAFLVDGRTVAYFGPFCALLRLPLLPFGALAHTDITRISCLAALSLSGWFQLRAVLLMRDALPPSPRRTWLFLALSAAVLFGGPLVQFLRPSLYQEVVDWAGAEAMGFVFLALRGLLRTDGSVTQGRIAMASGVAAGGGIAMAGGLAAGGGSLAGGGVRAGDGLLHRHSLPTGDGSPIGGGPPNASDRSNEDGFDRRTLLGLALCAGLALLTRVSVGLGLYVALTLLLVARGGRGALPPLGLLFAFAAITAGVNDGRWGDPLTFADATRYSMNLDVTTDRVARIATWGAFNPTRLPLGLSYYFAPLWGIIRPDGQLLFAETQSRLTDMLELPAGSFALTDPLLLILAVVGIASLRRWPEAALAAGLAVPPLLMLSAISMAHRYRMEFYPFFLFAALLGWRTLCRDTAARPFGVVGRAAIVASLAVGILTAHAEAALYAVSPWGPAEQYLTRAGWIGTYAPRLRAGHD